MNRRTFLQIAGLFPFMAYLRFPVVVAAAPQAESGQFVFDGVNGLTFPADSVIQHREPTRAGVVRFRRVSFLERILEVFK